MSLKRLASIPSGIFIEFTGDVKVDIGDVAEISTKEKVDQEVEKVLGKDNKVFSHVNRDGTIAIAYGAEPAVWPEDEK